MLSAGEERMREEIEIINLSEVSDGSSVDDTGKEMGLIRQAAGLTNWVSSEDIEEQTAKQSVFKDSKSPGGNNNER